MWDLHSGLITIPWNPLIATSQFYRLSTPVIFSDSHLSTTTTSGGEPDELLVPSSDQQQKLVFAGNDHYSINFRAIGFLKSPFRQRCGTPRQSGLCPSVRCELKLVSCLNAASCLDGLQEYSHLWVSYIFHKNTNLYREQKVLRNRGKQPRSPSHEGAGAVFLAVHAE